MTKTHSLLGLAVGAMVLGLAVPALAADVKIGILGDLTGPIEALAPPIVAGAQLAFDQVNAQGGILGGGKITVVTGDSACDPSVAGPAADKLVNTDKVTGIVGAFCTGATIGAAAVRQELGLDGAGVGIAVIDSGAPIAKVPTPGSVRNSMSATLCFFLPASRLTLGMRWNCTLAQLSA